MVRLLEPLDALQAAGKQFLRLGCDLAHAPMVRRAPDMLAASDRPPRGFVSQRGHRRGSAAALGGSAAALGGSKLMSRVPLSGFGACALIEPGAP